MKVNGGLYVMALQIISRTMTSNERSSYLLVTEFLLVDTLNPILLMILDTS